MKKQLLIAAVAATMSVAATADISITGDAYVSFASQKSLGIEGSNNNDDNQRVRIKVVGSAGDTKVVAVVRNGTHTRVDDPDNTDTDFGEGMHMDSLYVTTKIGAVDIKAGDYWGTIGLGAHSMEAAKKNALSISTKVANNWKVGMFTANGSTNGGSDSTNVNVSGNIGPVTVKAVHNPDSFTDISAEATFGNMFIAAEQWDDIADTNNDTTLIHVGGKVAGFKWDIAQIKNDEANVKTFKSASIHDMTDTGVEVNLAQAAIGTNKAAIDTNKAIMDADKAIMDANKITMDANEVTMNSDKSLWDVAIDRQANSNSTDETVLTQLALDNTNAETAYNASKGNYDTAETAYNGAETAYNGAQTAYNGAQTAYDGAKAAYKLAWDNSHNDDAYSIVGPGGALMVMESDGAGGYKKMAVEGVAHIRDNPDNHFAAYYDADGKLTPFVDEFGDVISILDIRKDYNEANNNLLGHNSFGDYVFFDHHNRLVTEATYLDPHATGKLAPLGSMLIGRNARGNTATAVADVSDFVEILGIAVSTEVAGNTIKAIYTKNTLGNGDDIKGTELIVSRPLSMGATLIANIGKVSGVSNNSRTWFGGVEGNATNTGLRLDVRF